MIDGLLLAIWTVVSFAFSVVAWVLWQLVWIVLWLILPLIIVAYVAVRIAEQVIGREVVRAWLRARSARYGGGLFVRLRRFLLAMSALPFRVVFWFLIYAVWHSFVSLLWRPKWTPWTRAWSRRWRPASAQRVKVVAAAKPTAQTAAQPASDRTPSRVRLQSLWSALSRGGEKLSSLVTSPSRSN